MPQISVIVPIYKVEQFIGRCAESLMQQTLSDVEFIFVDDCTPDDSMRVLREVVARYPTRNVKVLTHDCNKGLPAARNTGLAQAQGEYIFHCDSDDFLEIDGLEALYTKAKATEADIVWCDWFLTFANTEHRMAQPAFSTPDEALKAMLSGRMKYNVWNKLVRRALYTDNNIQFPAGYAMGEDMTIIMLMACAQRVAYVPKAIYHYVKLNTNAYSQTYSDEHLHQLRYNVTRTATFIAEHHPQHYQQELAFFKLEAKFPFLLMSNRFHAVWKEWYPEANAYILQNKNIKPRSRYLQWCAAKNLWFLVRTYRFVFNTLSRLIFR